MITARAAMIECVAMMTLISGASSFVVLGHGRQAPAIARTADTTHSRMGRLRMLAMANPPNTGMQQHTWSPQDLTKDCPGFPAIPDDDYVKKYQRNPELWPVEFFLIAYRRTRNKKTQKSETQVLVRKSANGTSKWGVGTGVPVTRWVLSTETPPLGYEWSQPRVSTQQPVPAQGPPQITFEARGFPEFPHNGQESWTYRKIDMREDAFNGPEAMKFKDPELEEYADVVRKGLRTKLSEQINDGNNADSWEASRISLVKNIVDSENSMAAIQGTLRMSGLFAFKKTFAARDASLCPRYVGLGNNAPDPAKLVQSMRIFTMFPQMPDPMPSPSTPPEELLKEITSRASRMAQGGRDPHKDRHGRKFTHKSTSNVSNTIHGVYLTLDATDLSGLDEVPALDLFGSKEIEREWKSLQDLKVLDSDGKIISTEDPKETFISGFIVRQLVKDGVIQL